MFKQRSMVNKGAVMGGVGTVEVRQVVQLLEPPRPARKCARLHAFPRWPWPSCKHPSGRKLRARAPVPRGPHPGVKHLLDAPLARRDVLAAPAHGVAGALGTVHKGGAIGAVVPHAPPLRLRQWSRAGVRRRASGHSRLALAWPPLVQGERRAQMPAP